MRIGRISIQAMCLVLAASMAIPAWGVPGDVMTSSPAPTIGADPPKARDLKDGDASVSTQTGALQYSYPIQVPPGRRGVQPSLALAYSSQGAAYGGVAAGWNLSVPEIRLDTTVSLLKQLYFGAWDDQRFVSSMAGGRPLVAVTEPRGAGAYGAFRAQNDGSYVRYERMNEDQAFLWRARASDGTTYYFGDTELSAGWNQPLRVPLTRTVDTFGNTVEYQWKGTELQQIRYTSNPAAGLPAFARVEFDYVEDTCGTRLAPGAADDLRINSLEGRRRLTKIRAVAFAPSSGAIQHTREYTLGYDLNTANCYVSHGLTRQLTSIQESAWGTSAPRVDLEPVTFEYNRRARTFDRVQAEAPNWMPSPDIVSLSASSGTRSDGGWPAVHSMLLDFDADGLPDKIMRSAAFANECAFVWQKNLGRQPDGMIGFGAPSAPQIMPRLPWATGARQDPEQCTLNFQRTKVHNILPGMVAGNCADHNIGSYLVYRWTDVNADGRIDLVAAIHSSHHLNPNTLPLNPELQLGTTQWPACGAAKSGKPLLALDADCTRDALALDVNKSLHFDQGKLATCVAQGTPTDPEQISREVTVAQEFEAWAISDHGLPPAWPPGQPPPGTPPPQNWSHCGYTRSQVLCDRNPWLVYENHPDPQLGAKLSSQGTVKYQVAELESDSGDSSIGGGSGMQTSDHAIMDLDGDGKLDLVTIGRSPNRGFPNYWNVFPGDGAGGFDPSGARLYSWFTPDGAVPNQGNTRCFGHAWGSCTGNLITHDDYSTATGHMLADLNGDGAADYVQGTGPTQAFVFYGNGYKFRAQSLAEAEQLRGVQGSLSRSWAQTTTVERGWLREGWRRSMTRLVDVDADGRADLIQSWPGDLASPIANWSPERLHINAGGDFLPGITTASNPNLARALVQKTSALMMGSDNHWATVRDLIDMDGDGLPEHWNFEGATISTYVDATDQPLRLLRKIDNGVGGTVEVSYAPTTKASVVVQDAARGKAMPHSQWVVHELTTRDRWDDDRSTSSYKYFYPVWNQDERREWGFRGFEEVEMTRPSGARIIDTYGFDVDWSGRLKTIRTFAAEDNNTAENLYPRTIADTTWQQSTLFGGAIVTYHAADERNWTCTNGSTEVSCRATPPQRTRTYWISIGSSSVAGGPALMWVLQQKYISDNAGPGATVGDRNTYDKNFLFSDANNYRLQIEDHKAHEQTATGRVLYDHWAARFDVLYRAQTARTQWFQDGPSADAAVTVWDVDLTTGITRSTRSPRNFPAGPVEAYQHDPTKRFVTRTTNEVGHVMDRTYEPGTGAVLSVRGPATASCGVGCNAPASWTDVDGLGRTLSTWVNVELPGNPVWQKVRTSRITYTDHVLGGQPTKVVTEARIEYDEDRWTREETRLDGQARPKESRVRTGLGADAVTTYDYDRRGHLISVSLPDPSVANPTVTPFPSVTYLYDFDSLGRPTRMRRPAVLGAASGVDISYNGQVHQIDEVAGGEGGPAGRKVLVHDQFGRLAEVREYTDVATSQYATTTYQYDPRDAVTRIQNPDGVVTQLLHDFAGRRKTIVRAGRKWVYGYDKNGQLTSEAAPPPSTALALAYTTTFAYDEASRPRSRSVGGRNLSTADQVLFGVGTVSFKHDNCVNGAGRLCAVTFPGSVLDIVYEYDAEGNATRESRSFRFAGVNGTRSISSSYGPGGRVREHTYADNEAGSSNATGARVEYDDRAMPAQMWLLKAGQRSRLVAKHTRNLAGLVTKRAAHHNDPNVAEFESVFTYDRLTRIGTQTVTDLPSTQLARQKLEYHGHDDPKRLEHWLGASYYDFGYTYDPRHQLTSVKEAAGQFSSSYQFTHGGKLLGATVRSVAAPGSDVVDRDVTYQYDSPIDPEAVSALLPVGGSVPLRSYSYDTAGNMATRAGGPSAETLAYDGEDQLRRATVGGAREEYFYDHTGTRMGVVTRGSSGAVQLARVFLGDTELVFGATSVLKTSSAHLSLGTPVARVTDREDLELQYHGLSNNALLTVTPDGTVKAGFVYAPYGELLRSSGAAAKDVHRRFNDKFRDDLTALGYYGVRYYDGVLLGWTQADPLYRWAPDSAWREPRRASLYAFCTQNPVRFLDPDGRDILDVLSALNPVAAYNVRFIQRVSAGFTGDKSVRQVIVSQGKDTVKMAKSMSGVGGIIASVIDIAVDPPNPLDVVPRFLGGPGRSTDGKDLAKRPGRAPTTKQRDAALDRSKDADGVEKCTHCDTPLDRKAGSPNSVEIDHRKAYARGGGTVDENLDATCRTCNRQKGKKELGTEWLPPKDRKPK